MDILIYFIW